MCCIIMRSMELLRRFLYWSEHASALANAASIVGFALTLTGAIIGLARLLVRHWLQDKDAEIDLLKKELAHKRSTLLVLLGHKVLLALKLTVSVVEC
jgi:hypothetical protein